MTPLRVILSIVIVVFGIALLLLIPRSHVPPLCTKCNIVVISAEALGIENINILDPSAALTPELAGLAHNKGVLFERAYSSAPWSVPAHAALMTGYYPWDMGIWDGVDRLPDRTETLASRLRAAGYATALFSNGFVSPSFGFGQGFDETHGSLTGTNDDSLLDEAATWLLSKDAARPSFAFIHTSAIALPYGNQQSFSVADLIAAHEKAGGPTEQDAARYRAAYREDVASFDATLGRFITLLDEKGLLSNTIVVITAGNGEQLASSTALGLHAASLSDEALRVPLLFIVPNIAPRRIAASVETRSLTATLLDVIGVQDTNARMGASLRPLIEGSDNADRIVLAASAKDRTATLEGLAATPAMLKAITSHKSLSSVQSTPYKGSYIATALKGHFKVMQDRAGEHRVVDISYNPAETGDIRGSLQPAERALVSELLLKLVMLRP